MRASVSKAIAVAREITKSTGFILMKFDVAIYITRKVILLIDQTR